MSIFLNLVFIFSFGAQLAASCTCGDQTICSRPNSSPDLGFLNACDAYCNPKPPHPYCVSGSFTISCVNDKFAVSRGGAAILNKGEVRRLASSKLDTYRKYNKSGVDTSYVMWPYSPKEDATKIEQNWAKWANPYMHGDKQYPCYVNSGRLEKGYASALAVREQYEGFITVVGIDPTTTKVPSQITFSDYQCDGGCTVKSGAKAQIDSLLPDVQKAFAKDEFGPDVRDGDLLVVMSCGQCTDVPFGLEEVTAVLSAKDGYKKGYGISN